MMNVRTTVALAAVALFAAAAVQAQTTAPKSRDEVKKEAAAAGKAGQTPSGELSSQQKVEEGVAKGTKPAPTQAREDVKKEAAAAGKAGATPSGELSAQQKAEVGAAKGTKPTPTKSREEVKKDAAANVKAGKSGGGDKPQ